jgi:hypothetical protein
VGASVGVCVGIGILVAVGCSAEVVIAIAEVLGIWVAPQPALKSPNKKKAIARILTITVSALMISIHSCLARLPQSQPLLGQVMLLFITFAGTGYQPWLSFTWVDDHGVNARVAVNIL